jgi:hypothetical protein
MKAKNNHTKLHDRKADLKSKKGEKNPSGYPVYPDNEDIYRNFREEKDINPEDITKTKESNYSNMKRTKGISTEDDIESDLDVPGAELDDNQENIGSEDEENNYYSLGGDDHNNLEEGNDD